MRGFKYPPPLPPTLIKTVVDLSCFNLFHYVLLSSPCCWIGSPWIYLSSSHDLNTHMYSHLISFRFQDSLRQSGDRATDIATHAIANEWSPTWWSVITWRWSRHCGSRRASSWTGADFFFPRTIGLSSAREALRSAATTDDDCCDGDVSHVDTAPCNSRRRPPHTRHASSDARSSYRVTVDSVSCRTWSRRSETQKEWCTVMITIYVYRAFSRRTMLAYHANNMRNASHDGGNIYPAEWINNLFHIIGSLFFNYTQHIIYIFTYTLYINQRLFNIEKNRTAQNFQNWLFTSANYIHQIFHRLLF